MVLSQKCFIFLNDLYQRTKTVAMGSPISSIMAEIFIKFYDDKYIKHFFFFWDQEHNALYMLCWRHPDSIRFNKDHCWNHHQHEPK